MKKIISLIAVLALGTIILASCAAKMPDETTEPTTDFATAEASTNATEEEPLMMGDVPIHNPYTLAYGAIPDSVLNYARENNSHADVQTYLNQMHAKYDARYTKGDATVDNELYYFMKGFNMPEDIVAQKLDGLYTDAEFKIICANDQKAINRAFVNSGYCYFSELDGKIYHLYDISKMTTEEIRQKQIPKEEILKLIENHPDGMFDFTAGKYMLTKEEIDSLRTRIAAM